MKKLAVVWGITMIMVFGGLTFFGFKYQEIKEYKKLETKMEDYAKKYIEVKKDFELRRGEEYKVSLDELKAFRPKISFNIKDDTCKGEVIVKRTFLGYYYNAELKCQKY